jgi:hypothetical protein
MASPEIGLPSEEDQGRDSEKNSIFGDDEKKRQYPEDSTSDSTTKTSENVPDEQSPIIYHYLTFETRLPFLSPLVSTRTPPLPRPPQPDLKKYISPFEWPKSRKNFMIWLSCVATLITAYTAGSYAPASHQMSEEWQVSETAIVVGITTFCTGFGIAPMVMILPQRSTKTNISRYWPLSLR